jgi:hypothetical protein
MAMSVSTVASGGMAVVDNTSGHSTKKTGQRVSEAPAGLGLAVTKVSNGIGMEVVYVPATLK